jgi:hypothetical protein
MGAPAYRIVKGAGRTMWCVVDADGDAMRFYSKRECEAWIARAERAAVFAAEERKARLARIHAYLAIRAERADLAARQLSFDFQA